MTDGATTCGHRPTASSSLQSEGTAHDPDPRHGAGPQCPTGDMGLILLNGLVFLYELAQPPERLELLVAFLGMVPARLGSDVESYWTLLTSMFLHGGWMHFIGNMWTLYLF